MRIFIPSPCSRCCYASAELSHSVCCPITLTLACAVKSRHSCASVPALLWSLSFWPIFTASFYPPELQIQSVLRRWQGSYGECGLSWQDRWGSGYKGNFKEGCLDSAASSLYSMCYRNGPSWLKRAWDASGRTTVRNLSNTPFYFFQVTLVP